MPNDTAPSMDAYVSARADVVAFENAGGSNTAPASAPPEVPAAPAHVPAPAQDPANSGAADPLDPTAEPAAAPQPPKTPDQRDRNGVQKRFDELTRRSREAMRTAEQATARAQELERQNAMLLDLARGRTPAAQPPQQDVPGETRAPTEADFPGDYRAFLRAEARWEVKQELAKDRQAREQQQATQEQEVARQAEQSRAMEAVGRVMTEFQESIGAYANETPGYVESTHALDDIPVNASTAPMVQAILMRKDAGKVLHYLSANPSVAKHIASLPPAAQASAIGEFAGKISARRQSSAPPPGNPSAARAGATSGLPPPGTSMADYVAQRRRQQGA